MNKNFVVIGASSGIGKAIVDILIKNKNYSVYALSRNTESLKEAYSSFKNLTVIPFDLSKNVKSQLVSSKLTELKIDYLINNAGLLIKKPFSELEEQDFLDCYRTNGLGVMLTVQTLMENFNENFSHIVNISTMGAMQGSVKFPDLMAYGTSKAILCNFTELFASEFAQTNTHMNCLCIGAVNTNMLKKAFPDYTAPIEASDMAEYIVNFTINSGKFLNGKIIPVSTSTP